MRNGRTAIAALLCVLGPWGLPPANGQPAYTLTDLGGGISGDEAGPAINSLGQVAFSDSTQAWLWSGGVATALPDGTERWCADINDFGEVAAGPRPAQSLSPNIWIEGEFLDLDPYIPGSSGMAMAINTQRRVVVQAPPSSSSGRSYLYNAATNQVTDLGTFGHHCAAQDINEANQVVGHSRHLNSFTRAFIWDNDSLSEVPSPAGPTRDSFAFGINDLGVVVGSYQTLSGQRAFRTENGVAAVLPQPSGTFMIRALDLNEENVIVGWANRGSTTAVVWLDGQVYDLNEIILNAPTGFRMAYATGVNNDGLIVGTAYHNGNVRTVLLTPVPSPPPAILLALVLAAPRRRHTARSFA